MIYIVTVSDHYYPCSGAEDWELVTRDHASAVLRAESAETEYRSATVIAINEDNLYVQHIWEGR